MNKLVLYILVFFYQTSAATFSDTTRLKLVFAGDIMGHGGQIESAYDPESDTYQYDTCFFHIKHILKSADIALANLEVTLAGKPFKGYPQFSSPDELADAVKNAGFNILVTANNHSVDRFQPGLERTIKILDEKAIIRTGTFCSESQRNREYPLIVEKNNIRLAILNYTYGTNGIPVKFPNIVNLIDTIQIAADLERATTTEPDFIIVTIHWGTEYARKENNEQSKLAQFLINHGADAVIGSHPHVVQPVRMYYPNAADSTDMKLVAYSLGNLISNQRKPYTDGGILLEMEIKKTGGKTRISNSTCIPVWVYRPESKGKYRYILLTGDQPTYFKDYYKMKAEDISAYDFFIKETNVLLEISTGQ